MSDEQNILKEKLERLKEELIDNILNTPDSEILNEINEEYGDSSFISNKVRKIIKNTQSKVGKSRLKAAKEELNEAKSNRIKTVIDDSNVQEKLLQFLKLFPDFDNELLLAARSGEEISENDAKKILEDLEELKNQSDKTTNSE